MRSQAIARVVPYRSVTCVVTASGWPQVSGLAKRNSLPCLGDRSLSGGESGRAHHPVRTHPSEDLPRQPVQEVGQTRGVVAGVEDDQDVAVADVSPAHLDQVLNDPVDLGGGDLGDVVGRSQTQGVQQLAPEGPARFEGGDRRVRPPGTNTGPRTGRCDRRHDRTDGPRWSARPGGASDGCRPRGPGARRRPAAWAGRPPPAATGATGAHQRSRSSACRTWCRDHAGVRPAASDPPKPSPVHSRRASHR